MGVQLYYWAGFFAAGGAILVSGSKLARYADIISEKTGMSRSWMGVLLLAAITSLPELVNGVSSSFLFNTPDIAVGDVFGSLMFNLFIITLVDFRPGPPISQSLGRSEAVAGVFSMMLSAIAAIGLVFESRFPPIGWVGRITIFILPIYFVAVYMLYRFEKSGPIAAGRQSPKYEDITLSEARTGFIGNAFVIVVAASLLPMFGIKIAVFTGLGESFVGNVLIGFTTSLPEFVVAYASVRIGAPEMAVSELLGSNLFDLIILTIDDFFYLKGPILGAASQVHILPALMSIVMTGALVTGILHGRSQRVMRLSLESWVMLVFYFLNMLGLYFLR